jgi:hypothetical protein
MPALEDSGGEGDIGSFAGEERRVLAVSMNTVLIAGAIALLVVLGVWTGGYLSGQSAERQRLPGNSAFNSDNTPVTPPPSEPIADPLKQPGNSTSAPAPGRDRVQTPGAEPGAGDSSAGTAGGVGEQGILSKDPRQPGYNYLELAVLTYSDATEAIEYLTKNGIPTAGVPLNGVDPRAAKAKNVKCLLFVLEGSPSQGYKSESNVQRRSEIESTVRRLGKVFQKEHKGASDFSEILWVKRR